MCSFPYGQILIGLALILGFATRFSAVMGFLMMAFITTASWDFAHGWMNSTTFLGIVTLIVGVIRAGEVYGRRRDRRRAAHRQADARPAVRPRVRPATAFSPTPVGGNAGRRSCPRRRVPPLASAATRVTAPTCHLSLARVTLGPRERVAVKKCLVRQ